MKRVLWCFIAVGIVCPTTSSAYEQPTHEKMSQEAAKVSVLYKPDRRALTDLGLTHPIDDDRQRFPSSEGKQRNILNLISDGARFEDNFPRSLNHFYDPINDKGLLGVNPKSPDWALEDKADLGDEQEYSYKDARDYLYKALTLPTRKERDKHFGKIFQTLGQVIHHIQDMAQPQHVRNDDHYDVWPCKLVPGLYNPSRYEFYINTNRGNLPFTDAHYNKDAPVSFPTARQFWTNNGQGIADFTNRNFVSAGTNFNQHHHGWRTV